MSFSLFLKKQLSSFVEVYEKYFSKTFVQALLWTILCFAVAQVLATYCTYDMQMQIQPVSILSFFILRFSYHDTYSYVDLTKTVFLFFVSVFSINLIRKITVKDVLFLLAMFAVCGLLDCALFRLEGWLAQSVSNPHFLLWTNGMIYFLRVYCPLVLFALIIQICTSNAKFTLKKIGLLIVAVWLFNEMSYEFLMLIRANVFDFILFTLKPLTYRYVAESILGIPLIASFFLGFYCAMTMPFKLADEKTKA